MSKYTIEIDKYNNKITFYEYYNTELYNIKSFILSDFVDMILIYLVSNEKNIKINKLCAVCNDIRIYVTNEQKIDIINNFSNILIFSKKECKKILEIYNNIENKITLEGYSYSHCLGLLNMINEPIIDNSMLYPTILSKSMNE